MMIPYTAEIRVPSKLAALELGRYIVGRRRAKPSEKAGGDDGKPAGQICLCEFRNPDLFLGMLLSAGGAIRVISPDWLREKLVSELKELLEANED
ncbi:MAG: WYL domain-containing protein, partial [Clostridia bacterium]|nr:WYL domain-containing protein [Clostridia bacterium]